MLKFWKMSRVILWTWCFDVPSRLLTGLYQVLSSIPRGGGARKNKGGCAFGGRAFGKHAKDLGEFPVSCSFDIKSEVYHIPVWKWAVGLLDESFISEVPSVKCHFPSPISLTILKEKWPALSLELILQVILTQVISQTLGMLTYNVSEVFGLFLFVLICFF